MLHHRFRELAPAAAPTAAFVPWALPAAAPQALMVCLAYRLAADMLAAQFAPPPVRPVPEFSRN